MDELEDLILEQNENIEHDENIINSDPNKNSYEQLINLMGLNININYPIKIIQNSIIEMYMNSHSKNISSKYSRYLSFRNDQTSKKIKKIIFNIADNNIFNHSYNVMSIHRQITRMYRNYKYNNIVNVVDRKEIKNDTLGFNYDNPRWVTLDSVFI